MTQHYIPKSNDSFLKSLPRNLHTLVYGLVHESNLSYQLIIITQNKCAGEVHEQV